MQMLDLFPVEIFEIYAEKGVLSVPLQNLHEESVSQAKNLSITFEEGGRSVNTHLRVP